MAIISPSILAANRNNLASEIARISEAGARWLHIDVMDGIFVPNIGFGPDCVASIRQQTSLFLDVHLMVDCPMDYLREFAMAGADLLTVHAESKGCLSQTIRAIHKFGIKAGVSLKPQTPVIDIASVIKEIDLLLLMSVNPGFSGQAFIRETLQKIKASKMLRDRGNIDCLIEVDGGINLDNAAQVVSAGADVLVAGSSIFCCSDISRIINYLIKLK